MSVSQLLAIAAYTLLYSGFGVMFLSFRLPKSNLRQTLLVGSGIFCTIIHGGVMLLVDPGLYGAIIVVTGCAIAGGLYAWARGMLRGLTPGFANSGELPSGLQTSGPYRLIRHPIYAAYMLGWVAVTIGTGMYCLLIPIVVMLTLFYRAARLEERGMRRSEFAYEYRGYKRRTGMFFPRLL